ncbi:MAG TPA: hypothetical protein VGE47_13845, partial [Burkholderiaceae bacterium]
RLSQRSLTQAIGLPWLEVFRACVGGGWVALLTALPPALLLWAWPPTEDNFFSWLLVASAPVLLAWPLSLRAVGHPAWAEVQALGKGLLARLRRKEATQ